MATATQSFTTNKFIELVPIEKIISIPAGVTLTLTQAEADLLYDICDHIGGCPDRTRRGLSDNIRSALHEAGVRGISNADIETNLRAIYFKEVTSAG